MAGHKRFRAGAWRLTVNAYDPISGKRKPVYATVHAPDNQRGEAKADKELAKLIAEVDAGRVRPESGFTAEQLLERWVETRRPSWERRSPGQADETLRRIRRHITPHIGALAVEELERRPIHITDLYNTIRRKCARAHWKSHSCGDPRSECKPLAESTVDRIHDILHSALEWAKRHDIINRNPADHVDPPGKPKVVKTPPEPAVVARLIKEPTTSSPCSSASAR